jgi:hypothetical protein
VTHGHRLEGLGSLCRHPRGISGRPEAQQAVVTAAGIPGRRDGEGAFAAGSSVLDSRAERSGRAEGRRAAPRRSPRDLACEPVGASWARYSDALPPLVACRKVHRGLAAARGGYRGGENVRLPVGVTVAPRLRASSTAVLARLSWFNCTVSLERSWTRGLKSWRGVLFGLQFLRELLHHSHNVGFLPPCDSIFLCGQPQGGVQIVDHTPS